MSSKSDKPKENHQVVSATTQLKLAAADGKTEIMQQLVAQLPWGHNLVLLNKLKTKAEHLAYAQKTNNLLGIKRN
jgi:predicted nuclease of restriction endonuclease-like (RecB) superfamily